MKISSLNGLKMKSIRYATYLAIALHFLRKIRHRVSPSKLSAHSSIARDTSKFEMSLYFPFWNSDTLRAIRIDTTFKEISDKYTRFLAVINTIRPDYATLVIRSFDYNFRDELLSQNKLYPGVLLKTFIDQMVAKELTDKDFTRRLVKLLHDNFPNDFFFVCDTTLATKREL